MNCIVIDDDASARLIIKQMCKNTSIQILEDFSSAIEAIKYLNANEIDVIFLDIHMPTFSGFDFIKTLKNPPKIILTTSDKNFALQAFEFDCVVDYLVKPIELNRFTKSVEKLSKFTTKAVDVVTNKKQEESKFIYVNVDKRLVKLDIPKILLIEANGDYISIKTDGKSYIVHCTLKKIEEKLPSAIFLKVHRSYIINTLEIIDIEDNSVLIRKYVVPISRSKKAELMERLNLL
ncbi:LytTR family DNA-binding domain-containing protein [uncultured Polaribacter sp.]|uniref:LytR/AlgR family response regulator transcription factor n=1 Tax=uncultured Polaribacter sp. TaxID=174711 RepID=UPI0026375B4A|nr:LytTR family DNA-binding domain-containing protein [uncultured Polaribacter sp.]